ncbi:unnamed protein product [Miscanthus lutarioriparius]|uniref:Uncharacterized protein n=1 Tax=Miscanthus lutarioriparius TaxID=422564 RepID=A0A811P2W0_9POAL|nr:unnamed protein product [Miscanthus lutarioriparius]
MASMTSLEASVEAKLSTLQEQLPQWRDQPFTIFRVPAYVRASNPTAYEPRMVSIGPYYHGDVALRTMEDYAPTLEREERQSFQKHDQDPSSAGQEHRRRA